MTAVIASKASSMETLRRNLDLFATGGSKIMTTDEMIAFWSHHGGGTVHPEDDAALQPRNRFETRLLPVPWYGPIKSARAFVALWNPGLDPEDVPYEARNATFREHLRRTLQGDAPRHWQPPGRRAGSCGSARRAPGRASARFRRLGDEVSFYNYEPIARPVRG